MENKKIKMLIIGNGAREHAIARAFRASPENPTIFYCAPLSNPGLSAITERFFKTDLSDHQSIIDFAQSEKINFAFIGPEAPLATGIVDALQAQGISCVGPSKQLAEIETSKGFARDLMHEYHIDGSPRYQRFQQYNAATMAAYLKTLKEQYVIKDDGLCGGKGVKVSGFHLHSMDEALQYCAQINGPLVIEEKLVGPEFSLMSLSDGKTVRHFPVVQDHKRAFENDEGPNTGGMGSYTVENHLLPFLSKEHVINAQHINEQTIHALQHQYKKSYVGILYGGFMLTQSGVKVIEFNARFGDPEAINLLSILKTDFLSICQHTIAGTLNEIDWQFENAATVVKYIVPNGYPDSPIKEKIVINNIDDHLYFSGVSEQDGAFMMTGSRAIAVLGKGKTVFDAEKTAEKYAHWISGPVFYRKDIGTEKLIQRYVQMTHEY